MAVAPRSPGGVSMRMGSPVHTMRHTSAIMNDSPSVTSTWASSAPASRRRMNRSTSPPKAATSSPATTAAGQKPNPCAMRLVARYAPSMKNEPCVRFGIRMSPKIRENPADSRNSRPPSVMLLTASTTQRLIAPAARSALERRKVPRVHRLREEPLLLVRPELAHLGIRLDRRVDQLVALALGAPDVEVPDVVAQVIEAQRPARRVGERDRPQRLADRVAVFGFAAQLLQRRLRHHAVDVETGRVEAGDVAVVLHHAVDEPLVARRVEVVRVERARDHPHRLVAVRLQQRVVAGRPAAEHGELRARVAVLLHELERVGAGEALDRKSTRL